MSEARGPAFVQGIDLKANLVQTQQTAVTAVANPTLFFAEELRLGTENRKRIAIEDLSRLKADADAVTRGKEKYDATCVACHGAEGKGNPALGAPNLTDGIWLHGSGEAIAETIAKGRNNQMPAHKDLLSPARIHLLTAYVLSLSAPPK